MTAPLPPPHAGPPPVGPRPGDDRSLGDLFSELTTETTTLVRQEIALAKAEITADAKKAGTHAGAAIGGGLVAYAGFLVLLIALGAGLNDLFDSSWLGMLLVGLVAAIAGYLMLQKGLAALKTVNPVPERTLQTLHDDKQWLKNQTP